MANSGNCSISNGASAKVTADDKKIDEQRYILHQKEVSFQQIPEIPANSSVLQKCVTSNLENTLLQGKEIKSLLLLNDVKVESLLHESKNGRLFKAYLNDKPVAIKVVNAAVKKSFFQERDALFQCGKNSRVVTLLASVLDFRLISPVFVFEYCHCSLNQLYEEPVSSHQTAQFMVQLTEGVGFLHEKGIIHLDLNPKNLLIRGDGNVVISGFGFSRLISQEQADDKVDDVLVGTAGYLDRQSIFQHKYSCATDIFALGCVFVNMWTGNDYMLCNWDIVNAYVLKTGNDLARFYQDVLKNGRPTDVTLETKQPLDERLKAIFGTIPQNKQFMYDVCSKMLNEIDQNRPKASEILNSNSFKTLQDQYLIMNASKWVKTQPVSITQSINMCHNYSKEMLSIAKMRIMNSFGFSKVASNFCEFFGFKNFVSVQQSNMPMRLTSSSPSQNEELDEQQRRNAGLPQNSLGSSMEIEQELGEGTNFVLQANQSESAKNQEVDIDVLIKTYYGVYIRDENGTYRRPIRHDVLPDGTFQFYYEVINVTEDNVLNIETISNESNQVAGNEEDLATSLSQEQSLSLEHESVQQNDIPRPGSSSTNVQQNNFVAKRKRGRPKGSFAPFSGIQQVGMEFICTVCPFKSSNRRASLRHRRTHIRKGDLQNEILATATNPN